MRAIAELLQQAVAREASDVHLKAGSPPILRISTRLTTTDDPPLSSAETEEIARSLVSEAQWELFRHKGELDIAYLAEGGTRFRVNVYRQSGLVGVALRYVKTRIPAFSELGLPPIIEKISLAPRGIVIVSGATGCGKSTTLAAMISFINSRLRRHIVTIEDPIEYLYAHGKSFIDQREVGIDTRTFGSALRCVMRQDPDVVMVGELRDRESFMAVLGAADVGRLALATLHTPDAAQVVLRIMDFFPHAERDAARTQLAANLHAVICQRLLPRRSGEGMVPAVEIMIGSPVVRKLIRDNRMEKLAEAIQDGREEGMQTFNHSLVELVQAGVVSEETAMFYSPNPEALKMNLQGIYLDESRKILGSD